MKLTLETSQYQGVIDGLRAYAVLSVIFFHIFPPHMLGGFIGVDIFFVISGYLITGNIFREFNRDCFSLFSFFSRRIRRIFPALSATVLIDILD